VKLRVENGWEVERGIKGKALQETVGVGKPLAKSRTRLDVRRVDRNEEDTG